MRLQRSLRGDQTLSKSHHRYAQPQPRLANPGVDAWGEGRVLQSCENVSQATLERVAPHHDIGPREIEGEHRHVARRARQSERGLLQIQ